MVSASVCGSCMLFIPSPIVQEMHVRRVVACPQRVFGLDRRDRLNGSTNLQLGAKTPTPNARLRAEGQHHPKASCARLVSRSRLLERDVRMNSQGERF